LLLYANDKIRKRREGSTRLNERFISVTKEDFILFMHSHTNELILILFFLVFGMAIKNSRTISKKSIFCTTPCQSKRTRRMKRDRQQKKLQTDTQRLTTEEIEMLKVAFCIL
jgi:hypothetical protein